MKIRNPVIVYILSVITGFIYFYFWMTFIMKEINTLLGEKVFAIKSKAIIIFVLFIANTLFSGFLFNNNPYAPNLLSMFIDIRLLMFIEIVVTVFYLLIIYTYLRQMAGYIAELEAEFDLDKPISKRKTFILSWLGMFSVIYIQIHMNRVIGIQKENVKRNQVCEV